MVAGESQDWSWAASGCVRSLFFVFVSYRSTAALKIDWKLDREEVEGVFGTWDIELISNNIGWQVEEDRKLASANTNDEWCRASWCWKTAGLNLLLLGPDQFRHHHHTRNLVNSHTTEDKHKLLL